MKKFIILFIALFLISPKTGAVTLKSGISSAISNSNINKHSVAISVKDADNGKVLYELNEHNLISPASVQKLLTVVPAVEILGVDYNFTTKLYTRKPDEYVLKLGADPFLSTEELNNLISSINPNKIKTLYIDDSIVEAKCWGEGWQWDDDLNTSMPRFNAYNLDGNLIKITLVPTECGNQVMVINPSKYPIVFFNNVITGDNNDVSVSRDNQISNNTITLSGTLSTPVTLTIPLNHLQRYFNIRLKTLLENKKIYLMQNFKNTIADDKSDREIAEISHNISSVIDSILLDSNNMSAEILGKVASQKKYGCTGSDINAIKLYNEYFTKIGLDSSNVRLVDSSGVSKNNLATSDFVSEFLLKNKDNEILKHMAHPGEGTLLNRMIPLKDNLKAKTGTLSDISSIAGYLITKNGRHVVFCILINNPSTTSSEKKALEDYIIREIYVRL